MKKKRIIVVAALAALIALVGGTVAYYSDSVSFENIFTTASDKVEYTETFESPRNWKSCDTTPKTLVITNKSDTPVAARFKMEEYWKVNGSTSAGKTSDLSLTYQNQRVAIINFQNENDWEQQGDWWVYKGTLNKDQSTSSLLASVSYNCSINFVEGVTYSADGKSGTTNTNAYDNATYHLDITAQTVPAAQKESAWGN